MIYLESFTQHLKLPIVFIGGLDYRSGDLNIDEQRDELQTFISNKINHFSYKKYKQEV